ncbi:MAG: hypothetical protein QXP42_03835 [Candidatus Micrarchaeia archaeon]
MGKRRRRGRENIMICASCGRRIPRDKAVAYSRRVLYTTDLKTADDIKYLDSYKVFYCISCAKHRKIFEKKKQMMQRRW